MASIGTSYVLDGAPVAFQEQDNWVVVMEKRIVVITRDGGVFVHDLDPSSREISQAHVYRGPKVAANPQDRWVFHLPPGEIGVITNEGRLFSHGLDWSAREVAPARTWRSLQGQDNRVGFNPEDWWVQSPTIASLTVGTRAGAVFGHSTFPHSSEIGPGHRINPGGPKVGYNPGDRFALYMSNGNFIVIITDDGSVWAHKTVSSGFGEGFRLDGQVDPLNVQFVGQQASRDVNRILLFRTTGTVVGYDIEGLPHPQI